MRNMPTKPTHLKTKSGAWLTSDKNPIAMRDCDLIHVNPETKEEKKQRCIFFSDDGHNQHKSFLTTYNNKEPDKDEGGFSVSGQRDEKTPYESIQDYFEKTKAKQDSEITENQIWEALWYKYTQNRRLREELLATNDAILVLDSNEDCTLGNGSDGKGQNIYGLLLMEMRETLKATKEAHQKANPPAPPLDWPSLKVPKLKNITEIQEKFAKQNSIHDFTRLPTNNYDAMSAEDKAAFIKEIVEETITKFNTSPKQSYQNKIEFSLAKKKKKNPQTGIEEEEDSITIQGMNGEKTSIDFEMTIGRKSSNAGEKKETITLNLIQNPNGSTSASIQKKADTFEERKEIFKLLAETISKKQMGGLDRKKQNGLVLTGAEEKQLASSKCTNLEVPDEGVLQDLQITVYGEVKTLARVTPKQAAAIAGFLEHFDTVNFTRKDGSSFTIEAPLRPSMMSTEHAALPGVLITGRSEEDTPSNSSFDSDLSIR